MSGDGSRVPRRISYAQNGEDVRVWRALRDVDEIFYVEVGASDPVVDSLTAALSREGGRGLLVEADPAAAELLRQARPRDVVVAAAASSSAGVLTFHELDRRGWGTVARDRAMDAAEHVVRTVTVPAVRLGDVLADVAPAEIHFLSVDVEGHEADALAGAGLDRHRPWILCVEATLPQSRTPSWPVWEPDLLANGYRFVAFDGLNRWYVAEEQRHLAEQVAEPFGVLDRLLDGWLPSDVAALEERIGQRDRDVANLQRTVVFLEGIADRAAERAAHELARTAAEADTERIRLQEERAQAETRAAQELARVAAEADDARERAAALQARHVQELEAERSRASGESAALRAELTARAAEAEARTAHLAASRSWRYTRPMREVLHLASAARPRALPARTRAAAVSAANGALTRHPAVRAALLHRLSRIPGATDRLRAWQEPPSRESALVAPPVALHATAQARLNGSASALVAQYAPVARHRAG